MKPVKWILPLIALCIVLGGCPYTSKVPIDNPSVKINPALIGNWKKETETDSKYVVSKVDDFTYHFEQIDKDGKIGAKYNGYLSMIGEDVFMNVVDDGSGLDKTYYLYKLHIENGGKKVYLIPITENITETFNTSAEMKDFITKYKTLSFFFGKDSEGFEKL